jgi:hypothetical protein
MVAVKLQFLMACIGCLTNQFEPIIFALLIQNFPHHLLIAVTTGLGFLIYPL